MHPMTLNLMLGAVGGGTSPRDTSGFAGDAKRRRRPFGGDFDDVITDGRLVSGAGRFLVLEIMFPDCFSWTAFNDRSGVVR
jgi:hypothetical protein